MMPLVRLCCALTLLAAYHYFLFPGALGSDASRAAAAEPLADGTMRHDIDASDRAYSSGRYADALAPTRRLTEKLPTQAIYFDRLANIYHQLGNRVEEARNWERVFALSPTPQDACPMLGQAYDAAKEPARALGAFERCLEVEPENPDSLLFVARAYQDGGRSADARHALEKAIALAPEYPDLYLVLGIRNYADGRQAEARQQFERFLALAPSRRAEVAVWLERTNLVDGTRVTGSQPDVSQVAAR